MNFWADAKQTQVKWVPGDPRLEALIAGSRFPGLYALVADGCVLKVGMAGIVYRGRLRGTVGKRLNHHLRNISRTSHPAWWEFTQALAGRELTVHTLRVAGSPDERRAIERDAIREALDGSVLWESMKGNERNERQAFVGKKYPRVLVEPGAIRRRALGCSGGSPKRDDRREPPPAWEQGALCPSQENARAAAATISS